MVLRLSNFYTSDNLNLEPTQIATSYNVTKVDLGYLMMIHAELLIHLWDNHPSPTINLPT